nr:hypothetical protein [Defluviicoccus vanus]
METAKTGGSRCMRTAHLARSVSRRNVVGKAVDPDVSLPSTAAPPHLPLWLLSEQEVRGVKSSQADARKDDHARTRHVGTEIDPYITAVLGNVQVGEGVDRDAIAMDFDRINAVFEVKDRILAIVAAEDKAVAAITAG